MEIEVEYNSYIVADSSHDTKIHCYRTKQEMDRFYLVVNVDD